MPLHVTALDIALRLLAAVLAGGLIGYERGRRGEIAGLRTMMLMCLAACGAMIEANLMLVVDGKTNASFTVLDALRFPLGILSGIGFIGAGAILRRGRLVTGVTTAATIWLITVVGLVLGAGYFGFGAAMTLIAFVVLAVLKRVERKVLREHRAMLTVRLAATGPSAGEMRDVVEGNGLKVASAAVSYGETCELRLSVNWWDTRGVEAPPAFLSDLSHRKGILSIDWAPVDIGLE